MVQAYYIIISEALHSLHMSLTLSPHRLFTHSITFSIIIIFRHIYYYRVI